MPLPIPPPANNDKPARPNKEKEKPKGLPTLPPLPPKSTIDSPRNRKSDTNRQVRARDERSPLLDDVEVTEREEDSEWSIDPVTGRRHKKLPKSEYDAEGNPVLQVDIDTNDLNSSAGDFLAHLQVAPTKEELKKMREEYAEKRRKEKEKGKFS